jgi:hypothetical protein
LKKEHKVKIKLKKTDSSFVTGSLSGENLSVVTVRAAPRVKPSRWEEVIVNKGDILYCTYEFERGWNRDKGVRRCAYIVVGFTDPIDPALVKRIARNPDKYMPGGIKLINGELCKVNDPLCYLYRNVRFRVQYGEVVGGKLGSHKDVLVSLAPAKTKKGQVITYDRFFDVKVSEDNIRTTLGVDVFKNEFNRIAPLSLFQKLIFSEAYDIPYVWRGATGLKGKQFFQALEKHIDDYTEE